MGLYINPKHDADVYKTDIHPVEPNQGIFMKNHTAEMVEQQKKVNERLSKSISELQSLYRKHEKAQSSKWDEVGFQIAEIKQINEQHGILENQVMHKLLSIEATQENLQNFAQNNRDLEKAYKMELDRLLSIQEAMDEKLEYSNENNSELSEKMEKQIRMQEQLHEKIEVQEKGQKAIDKRLSNQEALSEKVTRQLDHLRSILYERTNYLSEKIDKVSSFVFHILSDDPLQKSNFVTKKESMKK